MVMLRRRLLLEPAPLVELALLQGTAMREG